MKRSVATVDGNEACASVAFRANEVIAIYPITPASPMGEWADAWASAGRCNVFGTVPKVIEMQSEGGAAGAVHGALQGGALSTTFTASQGLLLMIPNMFKIAGELTSSVIHVAARSIATHALSIFGDHSDVLAARSTGWAFLCSNSVQEAQDLALVAHAATLRARVPFLHFFDGFRTSHEINRIETLTDDDLRVMLDPDLIRAHRERSLDPDRPVLRGSAQNPDVFFQAREAINPFYDAIPELVQAEMDRFAAMTGRTYKLFDYVGHPEAERVIVMMGSGSGAAEEAVETRAAAGERVGLIKVRLYRPFCVDSFAAALPQSVRKIAVLDRTKEPGAPGEPLYQDVVTALAETRDNGAFPHVTGGRYGLSSKEFTPAMVGSILDELDGETPRRHFTIGITDDVSGLSLPWDRDISSERADETRAVFYAMGSDGTVGANKNTVKIIGEYTDLHAQGYFVYDSKKSGSVTVSHLRFGPRPIRSSYLVQRANFIACHLFGLLETMDVLELAEDGATFLLNSPYGPDDVWDHLPAECRRQILERKLRLFVIDAHGLSSEVGLGARINTVMQSCFFAIAGVLPPDEAIAHIKQSIRDTYGKRGESVVRRNLDAVDRSLEALHEVPITDALTAGTSVPAPPADHEPDFVRRVTRQILAGRGDLLPVSAMPVDGTFPIGTSRYEKRSIAYEIPIWDPDICIECGLCALVCPHAAIRTKIYDATTDGHPADFPSIPWKGKDFPDHRLTIQVAPDDCTGCGMCVDMCPARSKESARHKAINMEPKAPHLERERAWFEHFLTLPETDRRSVRLDTVKTAQLLEPLFEFSGACAGCGETPYLKLLTQLFGDRVIVANATGCSSIYGGNLPTTPWSCNTDGRGPAWSNSLFEDNAEFGLGIRLAVDQKAALARHLLEGLSPQVGESLARSILDETQDDETALHAQRERTAQLQQQLAGIESADARALETLAPALVRRSVWIVGGDGWAYDIGFGGLDHVLATGQDVNVLVLDTEVYSNTGGQASKSTPRAAVAKYASDGKAVGKKDLGMFAMAYGNVYVAQIAMGANPKQTVKTFLEAESYRGPSLIIAYSHCIAHGIDMTTAMHHQADAVQCGYWPLYHYDPRHAHAGDHPLHLDSRKPKRPFADFAASEARFAMLQRADPERSRYLLDLAQKDIDERWHLYEQMVGVERTVPDQEDES